MADKTKPIKLIPYVYAGDFPNDVSDEFLLRDISLHYQDDTFHVSWGDAGDMPATQAWLIITYGEGIKAHDQFALGAT